MRDKDKDREENEVREAEVRYRSLFDQFPYGILIIDTDGNLIEFNEAAHRQLGYTREEFSRLRIADVDPVESTEEIKVRIKEVLTKGKADFDVTHRTKEGEIRDVHVITQVLDFSGRKVFQTIWQDITEGKRAEEALKKYREHLEESVARRTVELTLANEQLRQDIAERKKIEEALRDSSERYRLLFHNTPIGIFNYDIQLILTTCNDRFVEILQSSREKLLGLDMRTLKDQSVIPAIRKAIEGDEGYYEGFYRGTTGPAEIWISMRTSPIFDRDGKVKSCVGIVEDITDRKQAEETLRESEERYRNLFESAHDMVQSVSPEGQFIFVNTSWLKTMGYTLDELRKITIFDVLHPSCMPHCMEIFKRVMSGEAMDNIEAKFIAKDGRLIDVEGNVTVRSVGGKVIATQGIFRDITERRKAEEEKAKLELQLCHSQKMEAIGTLTAGISHEFRNFLTPIVGYIELLQGRIGKDDPSRTYIDIIHASAIKAESLTQSLLAYSRKQIINPKPVKLNAIVERVIKLFSRLLGEDIGLASMLTDEDLTVMADSDQIEQVLMNLCMNAKDAMPAGGLLTLKTELIELDEEIKEVHGYGQSEKYALISVTDTGTGMDGKTRERVFEPFFTTKKSGEGTGLGLAMVYRIVKQHSGHIDLYSEPGKGTSFKIFLPLIK